MTRIKKNKTKKNRTKKNSLRVNQKCDFFEHSSFAFPSFLPFFFASSSNEQFNSWQWQWRCISLHTIHAPSGCHYTICRFAVSMACNYESAVKVLSGFRSNPFASLHWSQPIALLINCKVNIFWPFSNSKPV